MAILRDRLLTISKGKLSNLVIFYGSIVSRLMDQMIQSFYLLWLLGFTKDSTKTVYGDDGTPSDVNVPATMDKNQALEMYKSCLLTGMFITILACPLLGYLSDNVHSGV